MVKVGQSDEETSPSTDEKPPADRLVAIAWSLVLAVTFLILLHNFTRRYNRTTYVTLEERRRKSDYPSENLETTGVEDVSDNLNLSEIVEEVEEGSSRRYDDSGNVSLREDSIVVHQNCVEECCDNCIDNSCAATIKITDVESQHSSSGNPGDEETMFNADVAATVVALRKNAEELRQLYATRQPNDRSTYASEWFSAFTYCIV